MDIQSCGLEAGFRCETPGASRVCGGGRTVFHAYGFNPLFDGNVVVDVLEDR